MSPRAASSEMARAHELERRDRSGVAEVDAGEHLAAVESHRGDGRGVVPGEPVVELERGACNPPRFIEPMTTLPSRAPSSSRSLDDVRCAEDAVDAGPLQGDHQPAQQVVAIGHRVGDIAHAKCAAGRMIGGDDQQASVPTK